MKLEQCPFCGSHHLSVEMKDSSWDPRYSELHVICNDCACMSPIYIWNNRHKNNSVNYRLERVS